MAAGKSFRNGDLVSTGTTADTALLCTDAPGYNGTADEDGHNLVTFLIKVISGASGVKFGVGSIGSDAYANPVGEYFAIDCRNGDLHVQQTGAGDTYRITVCKPS